MASDVKLEGIVLRTVPQKESDAMVTAIGPDGFFSFYARGIEKLTSKNGSAVQAFCKSLFVLSESSQGNLSLKEASGTRLLVNDGDFEALASANLIAELALRVIQPDEAAALYPFIDRALTGIADGKEPISPALVVFAKVLAEGGIGLDVDECVVCHKKTGISAVSYEDGGFVCEDCRESDYVAKTPVLTLKILRYIFRCGIGDTARVSFGKEEAVVVLKSLAQYLFDLTGTKLSSMKLIETL